MSYLEDIYAQDHTAQRYENYLMLYCPEHHGTRRSLAVYEDYFICWSCGYQGHPKKLLNKLSRGIIVVPESVQEDRKFYNPWTGWLRDSSLPEVCKGAYQTLRDKPELHYYLEKRGIPREESLKLRLGYKDSHYIFPCIGKDSKLLGAVARASDSIETSSKYVTPSKKYQNNAELLYVPSWSLVEASETVYVTFGIISCLSIYLLGLAAVSTLTGKKVHPELFRDIRKPLIVIGDWKEEKESMKLANELDWRGKYLKLPYHDDILDPNDMFLKEPQILLESIKDVR